MTANIIFIFKKKNKLKYKYYVILTLLFKKLN